MEAKDQLLSINRSLKGELIQTQEMCKQTLTSQEVKLREDETRRFNATFYSLDQKLKSVQDLREALVGKSQELQRDLMRAEKKSVEQLLAFESEREKLQDQILELNSAIRNLQAELTNSKAEIETLRSALEKAESESEVLKTDMVGQGTSLQRVLGQMTTEHRSERQQWEQQRNSTLGRIQSLEGELTLTNAEKRRALDEYVTPI